MEENVDKVLVLSALVMEYVVEYGPKVVLAIVTLLLGLWIINLFTRGLGKMMTKRNFDPSLTPFLKTLVGVLLKVMLAISVIGMVGIHVTRFVAVLGAAGLALQGTLQNFAGGVIILLLRPFKVARDFAGLTGNEVVYDLYTGTGTIANFVAKQAKKVVGVESVAEAIEDAKKNSSLNDIENTTFLAGDMKDMFTDEFVITHGQPDVIITDPPRAGMHQKVVEVLNRIKPNKLVYVSCNPATQARDLELLSESFDVQKIQPVDMFPQTHHVENVVLLSLRMQNQ